MGGLNTNRPSGSRRRARTRTRSMAGSPASSSPSAMIRAVVLAAAAGAAATVCSAEELSAASATSAAATAAAGPAASAAAAAGGASPLSPPPSSSTTPADGRDLRNHWGWDYGDSDTNTFKHTSSGGEIEMSKAKDNRIEQLALDYNCDSRNDNKCEQDSDCLDPKNIRGDNKYCGAVFCHDVTGTCVYEMWNGEGDCASTFVECGGGEPQDVNDMRCDAGPSRVGSSTGRCIGYGMNECVYAWCPPSPPSGSGSGGGTRVTVDWPGGVSGQVQGQGGGGGGAETVTTTDVPAEATTPDPDPDDLVHGEYGEFECIVDLIGLFRPMYGEPEMVRFIAAMGECTMRAFPESAVEGIEILDQEHSAGLRRGLFAGADGEGGRRRRTQAKVRKSWCRRCTDKKDDLIPDRERRRLGGEDYDTCMFDTLKLKEGEVPPHDETLGAFRGLSSVNTECFEPRKTHIRVPATEGDDTIPLGDRPIDHAHEDGTVAGQGVGQPEDGDDDSDNEDEEVECETTFRGANATTMLAQRELLHLDGCFVSSFNALYYNDLDPDADDSEMMVGSVVLAQYPHGSDNTARRRETAANDDGSGLRLRLRQLGNNSNKARTRNKRCRKCRKNNLAGDRRRTSVLLADSGGSAAPRDDGASSSDSPAAGRLRRLPGDWAAFNGKLAECLREGKDAERGGNHPFAAFSSPDLVTETICDMTAEEIAVAEAAEAAAKAAALQARRVDAEKAFDESRAREEVEFEAHCAAKEEAFRKELEADQVRFAEAQEEKKVKFVEEWKAMQGWGI